jgi:hypothetical protein
MEGMGKGVDNSYVLYMIHDRRTVRIVFYSGSQRELTAVEPADRDI